MQLPSLRAKEAQRFLDGLNAEQRAAVTAAPNGHILVLAGAGCGKTAVLTRRIAHLMALGFAPQSILALTFTRKAADAMAQRLQRLVADGGFPQLPMTTTFHGFGLRVLRDRIDGLSNAARIGYAAKPRLLEEKERLAMLAALSSTQERSALGVDLLGLDAWLEKRSVHPSMLTRLCADRLRILDTIAERVSAEKKRQAAWEFSDMLNGALELMRRYPDTAREYAARYRTILVDEFQDTNPLQIELLRMLLAQGAALFAVGDDDQAIYAFRGADTAPTLRFAEFFAGARILKLQTNYRSTPAILASANRIFRDKDPAYRKVLRSGRFSASERGARPRVMQCRNLDGMIERIYRELADLAHRRGVDPSQAALLFRLNQSLDEARKRYAQMQAQSDLPQFLTVHSAKGLEFPAVFLCDLEEGVFPSYRLQRPRGLAQRLGRYLGFYPTPDDCDMDEERRLFYVGVTRAQRFLYLVWVRTKMHFSRTLRHEPSRFLRLLS